MLKKGQTISRNISPNNADLMEIPSRMEFPLSFPVRAAATPVGVANELPYEQQIASKAGVVDGVSYKFLRVLW